jgi:hypothetical protein
MLFQAARLEIEHLFRKEITMPDTGNTSQGTKQDPSKETPKDRELDRIADKLAEKAEDAEEHFDDEHGIFTK